MFGLFESKSEKLTKKVNKLSKEIWATARRLCRKGPSDFWIKYFVETQMHLNEVLSDLKNGLIGQIPFIWVKNGIKVAWKMMTK